VGVVKVNKISLFFDERKKERTEGRKFCKSFFFLLLFDDRRNEIMKFSEEQFQVSDRVLPLLSLLQTKTQKNNFFSVCIRSPLYI